MYSVRDPASYCPTQPGRTKLTPDTAHLTRHVWLQDSPDLCNIPPSSPAGKPSRVVECYQCGDCRSHHATPACPASLPARLHPAPAQQTLHTESVSGLFVLSLLFLLTRSNSLMWIVRNKEIKMKIKLTCAVLTFCHFWIFMSSCNVKTFYEGPQRRSLQPQFHPPFYIEYSRLQSYICSHSSWPLKGLIWKQGQAVV